MFEKIMSKLKNAKNAAWWKAAGVRAVRTWAQAALGAIGGTALMSEVNWSAVLSAATLAAIISLLTSLAGLPEVEG